MNSLRRLLEERGLSHCQLSRMSGVGRETICHVSLGKRKIGMPALVAALALALGVETFDLEDIYDGHHPLPVGNDPEEALKLLALPSEPLVTFLRARLSTIPRGQRTRYLNDRELPDPKALAKSKVRIKRVERICESLGIHPVDIYGPDYYRASA